MPRALTDQEKCRQCQRLLEKGKPVVLAQGIRKVSVEDIARAAGMAKGSFYLHFETKEQYLSELIWSLHRHLFAQAEQLIKSGAGGADIRRFLVGLFKMPELAFFMHNHREIDALFDSLPEQDIQSFYRREIAMYEGLLVLAGVDVQKVRPGVVHNYIHALFLLMGSDLMVGEDLQETFDRMLDGLVAYIFGGAQ